MDQPKRKVRPFNWSRRLVQLAEQAALLPDEGELSLVEHQLAEMVARVVMRGSDQPLHQAIAQLDRLHHHEAANLVEFWANEAAAEVGVIMDGAAKTPGVATAFLIPLVLVTEDPHAIPLTVPTDVTLHRMAKSLTDHHLVGSNASVVVFPGLYREADLPQSWALRRQWLEQIVAKVIHPTLDAPQPAFAPPLLTCGEIGVSLRFLAGVVVTADDDDLGLMMTGYDLDTESDAEQPEHDILEEHISTWREEFMAALAPVLKLTSVIAGLPELWANALEFGLTLVNHVALDTMVRTLIDQDGGGGRDAIASIQWQDDNNAWDIALRVESSAFGPFQWVCTVDPQEELTQIMENLRDWGIGRMAIDERGG